MVMLGHKKTQKVRKGEKSEQSFLSYRINEIIHHVSCSVVYDFWNVKNAEFLKIELPALTCRNLVLPCMVYCNTQSAGIASFWAFVAICMPSAVIVAR